MMWPLVGQPQAREGPIPNTSWAAHTEFNEDRRKTKEEENKEEEGKEKEEEEEEEKQRRMEEVTSKLVGRDGKTKRVTTGGVGMAGILKIYCTEFSNI